MKKTKPNKVVFLMGPTAIGKTKLAIEWVQQKPMEIISVDSVMIYKGMDIGSGKPTKQELAQAPHHLINILDPKESYSAVQFRNDALKLIKDIHAKDKIPLLVGGTMLYFTILKHGVADLPAAEKTIREKLKADMQQHGLTNLHERLKQCDPEAALRINPNDQQRILRALEVFEQTAKPMSASHGKHHLLSDDYELEEYALFPKDRLLLHEKIEKRFEQMLEQGLIEEVKKLYTRKDLHADLPSIRSVGYRQVWEYLQADTDFDTMKFKAIAATRQLAKRQLTWLRRWENLVPIQLNYPHKT